MPAVVLDAAGGEIGRTAYEIIADEGGSPRTARRAVGSPRSILGAPGISAFERGLGPGVYDIHSPRVPDVAEIETPLREAVRVPPAERVWANPDCGLKTRTYAEVEAALGNLVAAASRPSAAWNDL